MRTHKLFDYKTVLIILLLISNNFEAQTNWNFLHSVNGYWSAAIHVLEDDSSIYIAGSNPLVSINFGTGYSSSNSGNNWSEFNFGILAGWGVDIYYPNTDTGYFVSKNFGVLKTINNGSNWSNVNNNGNNISANFIDENIFFLGKSNGDIQKTIDGGNNWITQSTPITSPINKMYFVNVNIGFATSEQGNILKTVDGGNNWIQLTTGITYNLDAIDFPQQDTGFVIERTDITSTITRVLKTTNGGSSWLEILSYPTNRLYNIKMIDPLIGYIVGENTTILKTIDGGTSWTNLVTNIPPGLIFYDIFIGNSSIFISGDAVYKTELATSFEEFNSSENKIHVYPNPAKNEIKLTSNLKILKVNIIDITGKKTATTLVNHSKIDISNFSSGIYFIEIITDEKIFIKKIVKQ